MLSVEPSPNSTLRQTSFSLALPREKLRYSSKLKIRCTRGNCPSTIVGLSTGEGQRAGISRVASIKTMAASTAHDAPNVVDLIDSDSAEEDAESENQAAGRSNEGSKHQEQRKRERPHSQREHARSVLHVKRHKLWIEELKEKGIREFEDPDYGRLGKRAQYFPSGKPLTPEDEKWWLKHTPRRNNPCRDVHAFAQDTCG
eukprot:2337077-Rhodomonas_salina.2